MKFLKKIFSSRESDDGGNFIFLCKEILGYRPRREQLYDLAFTHKSKSETDRFGNAVNYERLEFLGDAVLGVVIAEFLYRHAPNGDEGYLTQMRSKIVSRVHLNKIGKELGFGRIIRSSFAKNQFPDDVFGDTMEALIGAIYIDTCFETAKKFIYDRIVMPYVDLESLEHKVTSYKSLLIEWAQKSKKNLRFETSNYKGEDHSMEFGVKLMLDGEYIAKGRGVSKKKAEEQAAQRGYYALKNRIEQNR